MPVAIPCELVGTEIVPRFFSEADHPFLRSLLECFHAFAGQPERALEASLKELEDARTSDPRKRILARRYLWRGWPRVVSELPRKIRNVVFRQAPGTKPRSEILEHCGRLLHLSPSEIETALFADLPGERRIKTWKSPSPSELCLRLNLEIVQGLLFSSNRVRLRLLGQARPVVRHAQLRGLMCAVIRDDEKTTIDISGPYALFRRTLVYGRRLGEIVPLLSWCDRYQLEADCTVSGKIGVLRLGTGTPIIPSPQPKRFDSKLEERFAKAFQREARDWILIREPEPIPYHQSLLFPDFLVEHRKNGIRCVIEIVGFWMPEYLERKLRQYREVDVGRVILCIDELANCSRGAMPTDVTIIPFRRRIDVAAVVARLEAWATSFDKSTPHPES